jgi:predicted Zn-dependent protease
MSDSDRKNIMVALIMGLFLLTGFCGAVAFDFVSFSPGAFWKQVQTAKRPESDPDLLYTRAVEYYKSGDLTMAKAVARRVTYVQENNIEAHKMIAAIAYKQKDYAGATKATRRVLAINPDDSDAKLALAAALGKQGRSEEAKRTLEQVQTAPTSTEIQKDSALERLTELDTPALSPASDRKP